jgi:Fe-S cluster assembly ATPase SufC
VLSVKDLHYIMEGLSLKGVSLEVPTEKIVTLIGGERGRQKSLLRTICIPGFSAFRDIRFNMKHCARTDA